MEAKEESEASPPPPPPSPPPSSPSSRKSRRSVQKRVVSVPVAEADGAKSKSGGSEAFAPPSDSWAWRKYGQKPIKGSPYPRGYYRCSSSKGCPARKQVERSRADPTMFIVTYSSDHSHPWPLPKNNHRNSTATASAVESNSKPQKVEEQPPADTSLAADPEERFSDLMMVEEPAAALMMTDDFHWFADIDSTSSTSPSAASDAELFYGPIMSLTADTALLHDDVCDKFSCSGNVSGAVVDDEEDALFAGLEELPECSIVFRRGFLDSQFRGCDDGNRCRLEAEKSTAAASWCGSTR